jgi:protease-4
MAKKEQKRSRWGLIIGILVILFVIAYIFAAMISLFIGVDDIKTGNVAIIPIKGIILTSGQQDIFSSNFADSSKIVQDIEKISKDPSVKGIILEIDSPGGAPVATDEIATALKRSNKTIVAWIREVGASGGYWIASTADHVIANRMSITGSIGVYGSYLDFSGFINDWNVSYERLVAGKYKDSGVPFRELSSEERRLLQKKLDILHQQFKDEIQENRKLTVSQTNAISEGEFYLGTEALELGLVDELGGKTEAVAYIENKLNISAKTVVYEHKASFFDMLAGFVNQRSYFFGLGMGEGMRTDNIAMFR